MKLLERITRYFDTLHNFKSPAVPNVMNQESIIEPKPKFKILLNNFSVYLNGERVDISINNDTITVDTRLNIVINAPLFAVKTESGVHLNPETTDVWNLKETYERYREYYDYKMNCVNCDEMIERLEEDKERAVSRNIDLEKDKNENVG